MKLTTFAAAAAIALGGLTAAPALAQPGRDMHDSMRHDDGRHDNGRWDRGRHHGWNNHHRRQVCRWVGHRHPHRVCSWR